jgi:DNA repair protein SbcC/Rad50
MRLRNILLNRLPGVAQQFSINEIGDGIQILHGPNGIGKSSIGRAIESIFWKEAHEGQSIIASASFDDGQVVWKGEREGSRVLWHKDGVSSGEPTLPGHHLSHCFFLRLPDLLNASDHGTNEFADDIQRQLSGGYDLAEVRSSLFKPIKKMHGKQQYSKYSQTSGALDRIVGEQEGLRASEDNLAKLDKKILKADEARERLIDVDLAIELANHREEMSGLAAGLDVLPAGLEKLSGDELEEIEGYQSEVQELKDEKGIQEQARQSAVLKEQAAGLHAEINPIELADLRTSEKALIGLKSQLVTSETEERDQRAKVLAAQHSVGKTEETLIEDIGVPRSKELLEFLDKAQNIDRQVRTLEERISFLETLGATDERIDEGSTGDLNEGRRQLLAWLREGGVPVGSSGAKGRVVWIAAVVSLIVGAVASVWDIYIGLLGIAFGLGLVIATLVRGKTSSTHDYRADAEKKFLDLGLVPPSGWSDAEVESKLRELDQMIATQTAKLERDRDRDGDRTSLLHELKGVREEQVAVAAERQGLFNDLGIVDQSFDPGIVILVRALGVLNEENSKYSVAKTTLDSHSKEYDASIASLNEVFEKYGVASDARYCEEVETRLDDLANRNIAYKNAISEQSRAAENIVRLQGKIEEILRKIRSVYVRALVSDGDDSELSRKLEKLPEFSRLNDRKNTLQPILDDKSKKLSEKANMDLAGFSREQLDQEVETLKARAGKADGLKEERTLTTKMVRDSREGHDVEDKILEMDDALGELHDKRNEALSSLAGGYLMDLVENEHEQTQTPRVFSRAVDLFSTFTDHRYELKLPTNSKNPELRALDTQTNDILALDDLSDGTRTQLLLAAKLAYAEEVEQGMALPLFLDEALVQSDPNRFATIIETLGKVASDSDRQIFYLTSDPFDIERISSTLTEKGYAAPGAIDIAAARGADLRVKSPIKLSAGEVSTVPAPEGMAAEEYAVLLEVPYFDPKLGPFDQHAFYLLMDDPELLYRLVSARIKTTGQWRQIAKSPLAEKICGSSDKVALLDARLELLNQFCALWGLGRGRQIDRTVLEDSGAFTPKTIDPATNICAKYEGNAGAFLNALENKELSGYAAKKLEILNNYLIEEGYIDTSDVLDEDEIVVRVSATMHGSEVVDAVRTWVPRWFGLATIDTQHSHSQ